MTRQQGFWIFQKLFCSTDILEYQVCYSNEIPHHREGYFIGYGITRYQLSNVEKPKKFSSSSGSGQLAMQLGFFIMALIVTEVLWLLALKNLSLVGTVWE